MVTESDVIAALQAATRPLKARDIAARLQRTLHVDVTRSDVNQILYRLKTRGVAECDEEFKWHCLADGQRTEPRRAEDVRSDEQRKISETYYDILQVTRNAHPDVIMKVYKTLSTVYHPDRSIPSERTKSEERMKLINVAYETLSDPRKRAEYDRKLASDLNSH